MFSQVATARKLSVGENDIAVTDSVGGCSNSLSSAVDPSLVDGIAGEGLGGRATAVGSSASGSGATESDMFECDRRVTLDSSGETVSSRDVVRESRVQDLRTQGRRVGKDPEPAK